MLEGADPAAVITTDKCEAVSPLRVSVSQTLTSTARSGLPGLNRRWWSVFWVLVTAKSNVHGPEKAMLYTHVCAPPSITRLAVVQAPPPSTNRRYRTQPRTSRGLRPNRFSSHNPASLFTMASDPPASQVDSPTVSAHLCLPRADLCPTAPRALFPLRQHGAGERCYRLVCRSSSSGRCASARSCCSAPWCSAATRPERGTFPVPDYGALSTKPAERSWHVSADERSRSRRGQSVSRSCR